MWITVRIEPWRSWVSVTKGDIQALTTAFCSSSPGISPGTKVRQISSNPSRDSCSYFVKDNEHLPVPSPRTRSIRNSFRSKYLARHKLGIRSVSSRFEAYRGVFKVEETSADENN